MPAPSAPEQPRRADTASKQPLVLLVCPGLDHVNRGFETFARECFEALRDRAEISLELVKGSGRRGDHESRVPTLRSDRPAARALGSVVRRPPFVVEHVTFSLALLPLLMRRRPDVVYFSEWHVGRVLASWRRVSRQRFRLVMCNGSLVPGPYTHLDHVQQLVPGARDFAVAHGSPPDNQSVLPLGVAIEPELRSPDPDERARFRERLGLPADRRVVLSVAALNHQKRHVYVIDEVRSLPEPRPFLLLAGQRERETAEIAAHAAQRLGPDGHRIASFPRNEMPDVYRAADVFVLASLWEGSPRALVEALSHGLPCITHDYPVMMWLMGGEGRAADLTRAGALARRLADVNEADLGLETQRARHAAVYERFSWDRLAPRYVAMLRASVSR